MQRILVTGGRGFVGSRVLETLRRRGYTAVCFEGDVRRCEEFALLPQQASDRIDAVIHLAALITHKADVAAEAYRQVNVAGTSNLLAAYPRQKIVFASTTDVLRPTLSAYAASKLEAESLVVACEGSAIVRLPSVFGPGQTQTTKLIPRLLRRHFLGEAAFDITEDVRTYCFVDDAATTLVAALQERGIIETPATRISNAELDALIAALAKKTPTTTIPAHRQRFYDQLSSCASALMSNREVA